MVMEAERKQNQNQELKVKHLLVRHILVGGKSVSFAGSYSKTGKTATLKDVQIFTPSGKDGVNSLGRSGIKDLKKQLSKDLNDAGFDKGVVEGIRISGANLGKTVRREFNTGE